MSDLYAMLPSSKNVCNASGLCLRTVSFKLIATKLSLRLQEPPLNSVLIKSSTHPHTLFL
jgi:hypothetical protein